MLDTNEVNGFNAFNAHNTRVGDDNNFVRGLVEGYEFLGFGLVTAYVNERISVSSGGRTFTNVEVVVVGVDGWGIKPVPAINDRVLLFSTQVPVADIKQFVADGSMPAYDVSGLKAIPVTDSNTAQLITVSKTGVVLTGKNKGRINDTLIEFEDSNGNKLKTSAAGVEFEDKFQNKATTSTTGVVLEDKFQNKLTTSSAGAELEDCFHNKITSNTNGTTLQDHFNNKIETAEHSTKITDVNGSFIKMINDSLTIQSHLQKGGQHNVITMSTGGIFINDLNHNSITCNSQGILLNSHLKIIK